MEPLEPMKNRISKSEQLPLKESYGVVSSIGLFVILMFIFFIVQSAAYFYFHYLFKGSLQFEGGEANVMHGDAASLAMIVSALVGIGVVVFFIRIRSFNAIEYLALKAFSWRQMGLWLAVYALYVLAFIPVSGYFEDELFFVENIIESSEFMILLVLGVVLIGPLFEEVAIRGFLFKGLASSKMGAAGAIIFTAVIFSALHVFQYGLLYLLVIIAGGVIMGMARYYSGSLLVPVLLHAIHNALSLLLVSYVY